MKYIVNQNKFKDFLRNKFNFDLTGKIQMITNRYQVPRVFDSIMPESVAKRLLTNYGPMYLITINEDAVYIYQPQKDGDEIDDLILDRYGWLDDREFMKMWGIDKLSLPMSVLIDIYFEEE